MAKELIVILIAASPLLELRGAIPLAVGLFDFPIFKAFILSFLGNILPIIPLIFFLEKFSDFLMKKSPFFDKIFNWLFNRTRRKIKRKFEIYRNLALVLFVAAPLPLTGAWTGAVAAYLFNINKKTAFLLLSLGVVIAGLIVTALTLSGIKIFNSF